jgi:hypothetical protein
MNSAHTRIPWRALGACAFVCLVAAWLVLVTGCKSAPALSPRPAVVAPTAAEVGKLVKSHRDREAVQFKAAEAINVSVRGLLVEPEVVEQTEIIVEANRTASAQQIDDLTAAFVRSTSASAQREDALKKDNEALSKEVAGLKATLQNRDINALRWGGVIAILAGGVVVVIGVKLGLSLLLQIGVGAVGFGFLTLAVAQLWAYVTAQWWFLPLTGAVVAAGFWLGFRAFVDSAKTRREWTEEERENATARAALEGIVKITQSVKKEGESVPVSVLLARLGDELDKPHKALIEDIKVKLKFGGASAA